MVFTTKNNSINVRFSFASYIVINGMFGKICRASSRLVSENHVVKFAAIKWSRCNSVLRVNNFNMNINNLIINNFNFYKITK